MFKKYLFCFTFILLIFSNINAKTFVGEHGRLRVEGAQLMNSRGEPIALRGVSLEQSDFCSQFYNKNVVKWLTKDWKINVIRLSNSDESVSVENVIDAAIKQGIYVIVNVDNENIFNDNSVIFFDKISKKYTKYPNIIYEIFNEKLISIIRKNDTENPIINNGLQVFENYELCSMLLPSASAKGKWKMSDLSEAGIKTREYLRELNDPKNKNKTALTNQNQTIAPPSAKTDFTLTTIGRTETLPNGNIILIGAASMVEFSFSQKEEFNIEIKSLNDKYAFVSVELDGNYAGRKRIDATTTLSFTFADIERVHNLKIFKATEAAAGDIEIVIEKNWQIVRKDAANSANEK